MSKQAVQSRRNSARALSNVTVRDLKFVRFLDSRSDSRAAVFLLGQYATRAAKFFHEGHLVESLANARLFAEYTLIYVSAKERIILPEESASGSKATFYDKLSDILANNPIGTNKRFPVPAIKYIWRQASEAVHPPRGTTGSDIDTYRQQYQQAALQALNDVHKIARWLSEQYGILPWWGRLGALWTSRQSSRR